MNDVVVSKFQRSGELAKLQTYQHAIQEIDPEMAVQPIKDGLTHSKRDVRYYRDQCIHDEQVPDMDIRLRSAKMLQDYVRGSDDSDTAGHGRIELRIKLEALRAKVDELKRVTPVLIDLEQD